jgi:hypothetical protein
MANLDADRDANSGRGYEPNQGYSHRNLGLSRDLVLPF